MSYERVERIEKVETWLKERFPGVEFPELEWSTNRLPGIGRVKKSWDVTVSRRRKYGASHRGITEAASWGLGLTVEEDAPLEMVTRQLEREISKMLAAKAGQDP